MNFTFRKSKKKNKKYDAILSNGKIVSFGDSRYEQYRDSTGLQLYTHKVHLDNARRLAFRKRFAKAAKNKYSPAWFSYYYLW